MTGAAGGFVVIPNEVREELARREPWWLIVYEVLAGWSKDGEVQTWVPAIERELSRRRVRNRQGNVPCDKSIRRVLKHFRDRGWLLSTGLVNQARRAILGAVQLTLGVLLGHKKRECPTGVSKWNARRDLQRAKGGGGPVSKWGGQGFQAGSPFFKKEPVDNPAAAAYLQHGGPLTPAALRAMYGR